MRSHFAAPALATALVAVPLAFGVPAASAGVLGAVPVAAPAGVSLVGGALLPAKAAAKGKVKSKAKPPVKPKPAPAPFTVVGPVTAVDPAGSVTVTGLGGHKDLRNLAVTVLVTATTKVHLNDLPSSLDQVRVGFSATVVGTRAGTVLTAKVLNVEGVVETPTPSPAPTEAPPEPPTETPAPVPTG